LVDAVDPIVQIAEGSVSVCPPFRNIARVDKGGDENVVDLQHGSVDGDALNRPGGETDGLCCGAILAEPHHDFVRRIRGTASIVSVGSKEHIHTHVGIQAAGGEFSRRRDSRIVIANSVVPVNVDIQI
jgi:hypothetical protein